MSSRGEDQSSGMPPLTGQQEEQSGRSLFPPSSSQQRPQYTLPPTVVIQRNLSFVLTTIPQLPLQLVRCLLTSSEPPTAATCTANEAPEELEAYIQRLWSSCTAKELTASESEAILELVRALSLALASPAEDREQGEQPSTSSLPDAVQRLSHRLDLASALCLCRPPRFTQAQSTLGLGRDEARKLELDLRRRRHPQTSQSGSHTLALAEGHAQAQPSAIDQNEVIAWQATLLLASANVALLLGRRDESERCLAWRRKALKVAAAAAATKK